MVREILDENKSENDTIDLFFMQDPILFDKNWSRIVSLVQTVNVTIFRNMEVRYTEDEAL